MYAKKLQEMGAENVLISLGRDGAILLTKDKNVLYSKFELAKLYINQDKDYEVAHELADNLLLSFINDKDITQAFQKIERYYA